jgi:hypothetical protein
VRDAWLLIVMRSLPLVLAGGSKCVYDLALWALFRRAPQPDAPHDVRSAASPAR